MKRNSRPRRRMALLFAAFVVFAAVIGMLMLRKYEKSRITTPVPQPQHAGTLLMTLFFASPDGEGLVREGREIDACDGLAVCIEAVVDELVNGPLGDLSPTLPPGTTVRGVRVEMDKAVIDLNKEFEEGLPAGSSAETTAVYSIVNTVAANFPKIKSVAFLVEGRGVETLKGHLDLRQPLVPDFTLEKKQ